MIRASINQRYDFIHYIYTVFERMTRTSEPILRPMWLEFPNESALYDISSQFMVGDSILVAPKVKEPTQSLSDAHQQEIDFILPVGANWYNYQTKEQEVDTGIWQSRVLNDLE